MLTATTNAAQLLHNDQSVQARTTQPKAGARSRADFNARCTDPPQSSNSTHRGSRDTSGQWLSPRISRCCGCQNRFQPYSPPLAAIPYVIISYSEFTTRCDDRGLLNSIVIGTAQSCMQHRSQCRQQTQQPEAPPQLLVLGICARRSALSKLFTSRQPMSALPPQAGFRFLFVLLNVSL